MAAGIAALVGGVIGAGASIYGASAADRKIGNVNITSGFNSELAKDYENRLLKRLNLSPFENPLFDQFMGHTRRGVRSVTSRAEQQIKDSMPAGKQRDQLLKQLVSLRRGEMEALSGSATDLLLNLEQLRDQGVFQYLQGESQDLLAASSLRLKQGVARGNAVQRGMEGVASSFSFG